MIEQLTVEVRELKLKMEDLVVVLPERFQRMTLNATVQILQGDGVSYAGIGFFVRNSVVVTALHNLEDVGSGPIFVRVNKANGSCPDDYGVVEFTMKASLPKYDFAVLSSAYVSEHILSIKALDGVVDGCKQLAVTTFNSNLSEQCPETFSLGFGVIPATLMKYSDHYIAYSSNLFSGDSGAALIHATDGFVIGIHLETVNQAKEALERDEIRVHDVAVSVNCLVKGLSQGFVGLRLDVPDINNLLLDAT